MDAREELAALRRMAELEAKATGSPKPTESAAVAEPPAQKPQKPQSAWDAASAGDIAAGLPAVRMIAGAAAPVVGALQVGANIGDWIAEKTGSDPVFGKWLAAQIGGYEEAKKRGMAALGDTGADLSGLAASAATGAIALKGVAPASTYLGKIAQGGAVGAGAGALTPSAIPGLEQTGKQAAAGALLGGGIPAVAPAVQAVGRGVYRMGIEPLTKAGQANIKGRTYLEAAGDRAPEVVNALRDPARNIVPGALPTAGEAAVPAGSAEFAALQKSASRAAPSDYLARSDAQKAAQVNQLRTVGGTKADLARAEGVRDANALINYAAANTAGVDQAMAAAMEPQIASLMARPAMQDAKAVAIRLAADNEINLTNFGSVEGLDWLKKGLDRQIATAAKQNTAIGASDLRSLMQTKSDLLATIEQIAPAYNTARATFAKESVPVNQMQVGQFLENKLVPALGEEGKLRATSFAGAVNDAPGTLKRALTGSPRFQELTQVLNPGQMKAVQSVVDDLQRGARFEDMAARGAQAGPNAMDVATQSIEKAGGGGKIPNPLSRVVTVANAILGRLEGKINKKLAMEIAQEMLDPTTTANALEGAMLKKAASQASTNRLNQLRIPATVTGAQANTNAMNQGQ